MSLTLHGGQYGAHVVPDPNSKKIEIFDIDGDGIEDKYWTDKGHLFVESAEHGRFCYRLTDGVFVGTDIPKPATTH